MGNWQRTGNPDFRLLQLRDVSVQAGVTAIQRREATRCHILVQFYCKRSEPRKMHALLQSGSLNHQRMGNWDPESGVTGPEVPLPSRMGKRSLDSSGLLRGKGDTALCDIRPTISADSSMCKSIKYPENELLHFLENLYFSCLEATQCFSGDPEMDASEGSPHPSGADQTVSWPYQHTRISITQTGVQPLNMSFQKYLPCRR